MTDQDRIAQLEAELRAIKKAKKKAKKAKKAQQAQKARVADAVMTPAPAQRSADPFQNNTFTPYSQEQRQAFGEQIRAHKRALFVDNGEDPERVLAAANPEAALFEPDRAKQIAMRDAFAWAKRTLAERAREAEAAKLAPVQEDPNDELLF